MTTNLIQPSFAAGEISPSLYARVDLAKYKVGAATMRNFVVDYRGGAASRHGLRYICTSAQPGSGAAPRLIPFQFSTLQTYILEFGEQYMRVIKNGAQVTSGGAPYQLATPWHAADLPLLKFTQSADVMTLCHPNYPPYDLGRTDDAAWTLTEVSFAPSIAAPAGVSAAVYGSATGTTVYSYIVTAVSASSGDESTSGNVGTVTNAATMSLDGTAAVEVSWTAVAGAAYYNIYRTPEVPSGEAPAGSLFGLIGRAQGVQYIDRNGSPDFSQAPPNIQNPFAGNNWPGCCCYYLQRKVFAASNADPETFWMSQPGAFNNMDTSTPSRDDDAITGTIASIQVNAIKSMVPMPSGLILLSSGGAWLVSGGGVSFGGIPTPISPSSIVAQPQAFNGANDVPPIVVNYDVLFVQAKGARVRDLTYNFYVNIYTGNDLTVFSNHLFEGRQIREWAHAEEPDRLVWCVRDDGVVLSLTYLKEQDIYAWARHDTDGQFVSVASVSEGAIDAVYFVVRRLIGGVYQYFIERMDGNTLGENPALNIPASTENGWYLDAALALTQWQPAATLYPQGTSGSVTLYADAAVFSAANVGAVVRANGGRATITGYTDAQHVTATVTMPFPAIPNDPAATPLPAAAGVWTITAPVTTVGGLDYLDGKTVGIVADGVVQPPQVVTNGQITLEVPASQVLVGLPYQRQLQTLYLDAGEPTIQGKRKKVSAATVRALNTRGVKAGRTWQTLVALPNWNGAAPSGQPMPLYTGDQRMLLDPLYDTGGQICLQVDDPVPCQILGVIPEVEIGDTP